MNRRYPFLALFVFACTSSSSTVHDAARDGQSALVVKDAMATLAVDSGLATGGMIRTGGTLVVSTGVIGTGGTPLTGGVPSTGGALPMGGVTADSGIWAIDAAAVDVPVGSDGTIRERDTTTSIADVDTGASNQGGGGIPATGGRPGTGGLTSGGSQGTGGKAGTGGISVTGGAAGGSVIGTGGTTTGGMVGGTTVSTGGSSTGGSVAICDAKDGGVALSAGNPNGSCRTGVPAKGQPADTSAPTTVVGTGIPESCTFSQLQTAATKGGIITFNCGACPVTIRVTATLNLPTTKNTVIDGGNKITLDGGGTVQIMRFDSANFQANTNGLTLQHLTVVNGKTTPKEAIPTAPSPCSQGFNDGEGGALYMRDGNLTVIDSIFMNNQGAPLGPDTGGGAIYVVGSKSGVFIVGSTFANNTASNGGAVGCLFAELNVYNSLFINNQATGHDANNNDSTKCSAINNGQYETGSGGNGGALYSDGNSVNITLCGDAILNNSAGNNAFGGGLFFTSNDMGGTLSIADTTMTGNTGGSWTNVSAGSVTNLGSAVGTNCKSITVTNSTIQK